MLGFCGRGLGWVAAVCCLLFAMSVLGLGLVIVDCDCGLWLWSDINHITLIPFRG